MKTMPSLAPRPALLAAAPLAMMLLMMMMAAAAAPLAEAKKDGPGTRGLSTTSFKLDFEGLLNFEEVSDYYDGRPGGAGGTDYGVSFGPACRALIDADAPGGTGLIANEPSASTVLTFFDVVDTYMTVDAGFVGLSFQYATSADCELAVYDGPDGTGNLLASYTFPKSGVCDFDDGTPGDFPACGDPTGFLGEWLDFSVVFDIEGPARSVAFLAPNFEEAIAIDDIYVFQEECDETTYWLWDPTTNEEAGEILDDDAICIPSPYNIEARPCAPPEAGPVVLTLRRSSGRTVHTRREFVPPYFLWGDDPETGDVFNSRRPLPDGEYTLSSRAGPGGSTETITFTQACGV